MPTLDRDVAEAIYELLGDTYETERYWYSPAIGMPITWKLLTHKPNPINASWYPAPDFSETIRLLPKIGEKKGWDEGRVLQPEMYKMVWAYAFVPTEEQGMKQVSEYLRKIL